MFQSAEFRSLEGEVRRLREVGHHRLGSPGSASRRRHHRLHAINTIEKTIQRLHHLPDPTTRLTEGDNWSRRASSSQDADLFHSINSNNNNSTNNYNSHYNHSSSFNNDHAASILTNNYHSRDNASDSSDIGAGEPSQQSFQNSPVSLSSRRYRVQGDYSRSNNYSCVDGRRPALNTSGLFSSSQYQSGYLSEEQRGDQALRGDEVNCDRVSSSPVNNNSSGAWYEHLPSQRPPLPSQRPPLPIRSDHQLPPSAGRRYDPRRLRANRESRGASALKLTNMDSSNQVGYSYVYK